MKKMIISAAAVAAVTWVGSLSAYAEYAGGGPLNNGSQCFSYSRGMYRDGRFGTWGNCPQTASQVRTTTRTRGRQAPGTPAAAAPSNSGGGRPANYSGG